MKVGEAKTKVCPFIQGSGKNQYKDYDGEFSDHINCICSDCMAWRYTKTHEQILQKPKDYEGKVCMPKYLDGNELDEHEKEGYCERLKQ